MIRQCLSNKNENTIVSFFQKILELNKALGSTSGLEQLGLAHNNLSASIPLHSYY